MLRARLGAAGVATILGLSVLFTGAAGAQEGDEEISHAAEECIELLEEGREIDDCQEAPNPILPEGSEIVWGGLGFLVLFLLLWKKGLPPIRNMMHAREEKIRNDLESAERARREAEEEKARFEAQLADARAQANRIVEEARQAADEVRRDLIARAEGDAAEIRSRGHEDARLAADRAMSDLQQRVGDLSIELAERIVERNLDRETQMALVESYIASVGNGQGGSA